jgi:hypothetical protein
VTTEDKLLKLLDLADECRRVQKVFRRPPNVHEQRALAQAERALDVFVTELQTEVLISPDSVTPLFTASTSQPAT